jgi:hypothetical protein
MAWVDSYTGWSNKYRVGVGYEIVTPYNAATNKTVIRVRLIADADTGQWFVDWDCSGFLKTYNTSGTANTNVQSYTITSDRFSFPSSGSSIVAYTSGNFDIVHDKNGVGTFYITGKFGMDSTSPSYYMPVQTKTTSDISTGNGTITPTTPSSFVVTPGAVDLVANTRVFSLSASGSTVVAGIDGSHSITYNYEYSTNNSTWSPCSSSATLSAKQKYYFRAYASCEGSSSTYGTGTVYYGYPESVSSLSISRQTTLGNGNKIDLSWSEPSTTGSGAAISEYKLAYASSSDDGASWSDWSTESSATGTSYTFSLPTLGRRYKFYIKPYSSTSGFTGSATDSTYSYVPSLPTTSSITSLTKDVKKTITAFSSSDFDSATGTGYEVSARYSGDNGSTWSSWSTLSSSATSPYTSADLNIAKLYEIRVRPYSDVGFGSYSTSSQIFISAYGYRIDSSLNAVAIELAARYTGNESDSIVVGSETKTGWKQIESMKRYNGTSFIDFIQ